MKLKPLFTFLMALLPCTWVAAQGGENLQITSLGADNTLVTFDAANEYLLLPIEEYAPEAKVNVLIDGQIVQQFTARLAQSKHDYFVPFKLKPYKGRHVVLNIETSNERSRVRFGKTDVCWKLMKLADTFPTDNTEKYRPAYHHTPLYGWMNDPNGMFWKDGVWHLYYQFNPYGSMWGNMTWGHSTSRDLLHWDHHPEAIWADGLGAVFSGSCVVDKNNTAGFGKDAVVAIYTSAGKSQQQSLAYSTDGGMTFTKYPYNPIITSDKETRDDNFFWDEEHGYWVLALADALTHQDLFYTSPDLKHWTLTGKFGLGYGSQNGVWECPDLMRLPVRGTNKHKWVLLVNINPGAPFGGSGTQYFVGEWDGKTFTCDEPSYVTKWIDYGRDHYAAVSWSNAPDGRKTIIGWMSNWQYANIVPTMQFRSANTLPRELDLIKADDGSYVVASLPSPECLNLRGEKTSYGSMDADGSVLVLPKEKDGLYEIVLTVRLDSRGKADIVLMNDKDERVTMTYDAQAQSFSMDRTQSGLTDFSDDFPCTTLATTSRSRTQELRLFIDRCSIEAFAGDGRFAMTNLVFPSEPYSKISVSGGCRVQALDVYKINP